MMSNIKNPLYLENGFKSGKLTVIDVVEESKEINGITVIPSRWKYKCLCECGRTTSVVRSNLVQKTTQSCGICIRLKYPEILENGSIYKYFTVKKVDETSKYKKDGSPQIKSQWKYVCTCHRCGVETVVAKREICAGLTKSCGCITEDASEYMPSRKHPKYLKKGETYGKFTILGVVEESKIKNNKAVPPTLWLYKCMCDCKNKTVVEVSKNSICRGSIRSCGCINKERLKRNRKKNEYKINGDTALIYFDNSKEYFIIDKEDFEKVYSYFWRNDGGYPRTMLHTGDTEVKHKRQTIHRFLMNAPEGSFVDHIDGDVLNNRRENLRFCELSENNRNKRISKNNTSGQVGVYKAYGGKWKASLHKNKKFICLGTHDTYEQAVRARLEGEAKYFKEFAPSICREEK